MMRVKTTKRYTAKDIAMHELPNIIELIFFPKSRKGRRNSTDGELFLFQTI